MPNNTRAHFFRSSKPRIFSAAEQEMLVKYWKITFVIARFEQFALGQSRSFTFNFTDYGVSYR